MHPDSTLALLTPAAYGVAAVTYLGRFFRGREIPRALLAVTLVGALALHASWALVAGIDRGGWPAANAFEVLSGIALALVLVYASIEFRIGQTSTGFFVLVVAVGLTSMAALEGLVLRNATTEGLEGPIFGVHVLTAMIGCSAAALSAVYGLLYLLLYRQLKTHQFGTFYKRLPPLEVLERITYVAALIAFATLSIAIPLGLVQLRRVHDTWWLWDPKILTGIATWFVFGTVSASRRWLGWNGRRLAYGSLAGFALVLVSLVVVNLFLTDFHLFG